MKRQHNCIGKINMPRIMYDVFLCSTGCSKCNMNLRSLQCISESYTSCKGSIAFKCFVLVIQFNRDDFHYYVYVLDMYTRISTLSGVQRSFAHEPVVGRPLPFALGRCWSLKYILTAKLELSPCHACNLLQAWLGRSNVGYAPQDDFTLHALHTHSIHTDIFKRCYKNAL